MRDWSVTGVQNCALPAVITSAAIGSTVHDSATVTGTQAGGTPTGTVTFTVYSSPDCSTGGVAGTPVALNGSGGAERGSVVEVLGGGVGVRGGADEWGV